MKTIPTLMTIGQVAKLLGVCVGTIRRWCREGRLQETSRTFGNHRRFSIADIEKLQKHDSDDNRKVVGYARVSGHDQAKDLQRQVNRLRRHGCAEVISDLGSGLNCKKKGLRQLLGMICSRRISKLVLVHEDRLLRFGTELVFFLCRRFGTEVVILEASSEKPFEEELVKDVITLMTVFSARLYGKRSWKNRKKVVS